MLSKPSKLLRNLPRESRDTLFILLVIAWVLLPQSANRPLGCTVLACGMLLWRGYLALNNLPLPGRGWLMGLLVITFGATLLTHKTLLGIDAGVTLMALLLTLKTLELRARRDAFVVFYLGFFCMLSNFFYSQSLLAAVSMLLGFIGLLTVLVNAHMPIGKPPLMEAAKTASWMTLLGAPIMVVLFVLFPRMSPLWGVSSDTVRGKSGLSEIMQVGSIAQLALDDSVSMRIKFDGQPPPQRDMYLRGPVLSNFDGRQWRPARSDVTTRFSPAANLVVTGSPINYEVTLEPTNRPWLFVLDAAPYSPQLAGYQTVMQADLQWVLDKPANDLIRYKAQSFTSFTHGPEKPVTGLQEFMKLPPGFNPRTLAMANEIRSDARYTQAGSAELVQLVIDRLRTGGYTYTLEPGMYGPHTADEFWFDTQKGFCEHIASSFVILMRALNVPARIVTGYHGGEKNTVDNFWVIRQSDAHAWAEVWQAGRGWVRVDPTAAVSPGRTGSLQRLVAPQGVVGQALSTISPGFSVQLRAVWEAANNAWNQRVLNYTQGKQLELMKNIGFESPSWQDLSIALIAISVALSLAGAAASVWEHIQHDPWLRLLNKTRQRMVKAGIVTPENMALANTPRQLATLLRARHGSQYEVLHSWLLQLEEQRYARPAAPGKQIHQLKQQFAAIKWPA